MRDKRGVIESMGKGNSVSGLRWGKGCARGVGVVDGDIPGNQGWGDGISQLNGLLVGFERGSDERDVGCKCTVDEVTKSNVRGTGFHFRIRWIAA